MSQLWSWRTGLILVACLVLLPPSAVGVEPTDGPSTADDLHIRETPREATVGFLVATRAGAFGDAARFLDLGQMAADDAVNRGPRLARRLKIVLDNTFWVDPHVISDQSTGDLDDGLAVDQEILTTIAVESRQIPIRLHRVGTPQGEMVWLFDQATVAAIDELYAEHGFGWLGDHLPAFFFTVRFFEVELWQLIVIVFLFGFGYVVARLLTRPLLDILKRGAKKTTALWDDELALSVRGPLTAGLFAFVVFFGTQWLGLAEPVHRTLVVFWGLAAIVILGWLLSCWVSVGARLLERMVAEEGGSLARSFIPLFARVIRIGVWALVLVVGLDVAGVEVMGLIAGLGIGGLAVAFAAKQTIENFFGAVAIASDRPFETGDYVSIDGSVGTIEEVGLRSTRLRTTARTLITIPNGRVMAATIENNSARDRMLFNPTIGLVYGTTRAQIELVVDELKKMLACHPMVFQETFRVRLAGFGASSIDIALLSWVDTTDYHEFTAVVEELNLEIMRIVEEAGTAFAFPSQTLYLAREGGVDPGQADAAAEEVETRRNADELWIPEPPG